LDALQAIRRRVGPDVEIIMDGGVQRGTDVATALALGADGVGVGKAYLYGLGAGGRRGVERALDMLDAEFRRAMGLLGVASIEELKKEGPSLVVRRPSSGYGPRDSERARYAPAEPL